MTDSIQQRVARGAQWLDEVRPGWRDAIDLGDLNLISTCNCVLGQVFEEAGAASPSQRDGYWHVISNLRPQMDTGEDMYEWPKRLGFASIATEGHMYSGLQYQLFLEENDELNAEWRRVIHQGRELPTHPATQREAVQA